MAGNNNGQPVPIFLKEWREFRGLTQLALAARVDLSGPAISQLEAGKQGFTSDTLAKFAKALDCTPVELLAYDPNKPSFWPLFFAAERLQGHARSQVEAVMKALIPGSTEKE